MSNREHEDAGEAGDCWPLGFNEAAVDAEYYGLDVLDGNGTGSEWRQEVAKSSGARGRRRR